MKEQRERDSRKSSNRKEAMEETPQQQQEAKNPAPDDLVNAFIEITSATHQEALFFLESHGFDLDSAVSTFLETTSLPPDSVPPRRSRNLNRNRNRSPSDSPPQSYSPSSSPSRSRSRSRSPPSAELELPVVNSYNLRSGRSDKKKASSSRASRSVRTISDLNRAASDDEVSDSDAPQEYYTGGEKSGMLVQDPSKKKNNDVEALFNQVRQAGAEEGTIDHLQPSSSSRSFSGRARILSGETVASSSVPQEPITHTITFWTNGFTIDDGPLRRLDDPENASFLESIKNSECPKELKPATKGADVHVSLVRKLEDFPVPQKRLKPFHGIARTLGSTSGTAIEESAVPETPLNAAPTPSMGLVVDQTLPSTSIQLRLVDGTRMVSRFNLHHTISDIRSFIDASRPDGESVYQLQTMEFPPKQLTDLNMTIEQAGIANSVVIQKL